MARLVLVAQYALVHASVSIAQIVSVVTFEKVHLHVHLDWSHPHTEQAQWVATFEFRELRQDLVHFKGPPPTNDYIVVNSSIKFLPKIACIFIGKTSQQWLDSDNLHASSTIVIEICKLNGKSYNENRICRNQKVRNNNHNNIKRTRASDNNDCCFRVRRSKEWNHISCEFVNVLCQRLQTYLHQTCDSLAMDLNKL